MATPTLQAPSTGSVLLFPLALRFVPLTESGVRRAGYGSSEKRGLRELREVTLSWSLDPTGEDWARSFIAGLEGGDGPVYYTLPQAVPPASAQAPTLAEVSGGSLGARTYTIKLSWYDSVSTQETTLGLGASLAISANNLIRVTAPILPNGVDSFRVYADDGATINDELQATVTGSRVWTEPTGGLIAGAAAPGTNNLKPAILWRIARMGDVTRIRPKRSAWTLTLVEEFI